MAKLKTMQHRQVFSMPEDLKGKIEDYRFAQRIGSESEAIRRLIEAGLQTEAARAAEGTEGRQ